jgi:phosphatidylinositol 4-kinase B
LHINLFYVASTQVCIPLWCDSSDAEISPEPHHRVVRIPPGESVVLNSADRAPYLLIVEILHGDLDFDPARGENKEVLRKMVLKEIGHRGVYTELPDWTGGPAAGASALGFKDDAAQDVSVTEHDDPPSMGTVIPPTPIDPPPRDELEEEVDVVEQLYGADLSFRSQAAALNDSIALPAARKNKDLDMEAWSKAASAPSSPALGPQASPQTAFSEHVRTLSDTGILHTSSNNHTPHPSPLAAMANGHGRAPLSLEDYSERMRTAAVMLAQLNSNVVREPVTTITAPGITPVTTEGNAPLAALSWIPGSSWLPGLSAAGPSVAGQGPDANPPTMRMRLQRSEAQTIRDRIMQEMLALEEERMERMRASNEGGIMNLRDIARSAKTVEDEGIIRRELNKADPSAAVFRESWTTKKVSDAVFCIVCALLTCLARRVG